MHDIVSLTYIPGHAVEEEKAAGEDVVQLVELAEVHVGPEGTATVVDVQHRYRVKFAGSLPEVEVGMERALFYH